MTKRRVGNCLPAAAFRNVKMEINNERQRKNGKQRRSGKHGIILPALFALFFLLFAVFAALFADSWLKARSEAKDFEELAILAEAARPTQAVWQAEPARPSETEKTVESSPEAVETDNRERFAALYERNSDFTGWLCIEDTAVNYPVMLTPDDPEYYLRRDYDGNASASGVPFLGEGCTPDSDNAIIYGHNMKSGSMFADLTKYIDQSFFQTHPVIQFDTMERSSEYEIIAVFRERVHDKNEANVFRYYTYGGSLTEEQFNEYLVNIKELSIYDTGVTASYGDQLLTLSTCSYHSTDGRFVVVARRHG